MTVTTALDPAKRMRGRQEKRFKGSFLLEDAFCAGNGAF